MPKDLQNADLTCDSFDVRLFHYFLFLECFNCHFFIALYMDSKTHFTESAFSNTLAFVYAVIPILYCPSMNSEVGVLINKTLS